MPDPGFHWSRCFTTIQLLISSYLFPDAVSVKWTFIPLRLNSQTSTPCLVLNKPHPQSQTASVESVCDHVLIINLSVHPFPEQLNRMMQALTLTFAGSTGTVAAPCEKLISICGRYEDSFVPKGAKTSHAQIQHLPSHPPGREHTFKHKKWEEKLKTFSSFHLEPL